MKVPSRRFLILAFALVLGLGALWATASRADRPERATLPVEGKIVGEECDFIGADPTKAMEFPGLGQFQPTGVAADKMVVVVGKAFISEQGLKTVPLQVLANGGRSFAEGIGETRFWVDASRPIASAIWEKRPGTEFPAIQEMRFHFFYTLEAMPGKVFRSMNPSRMRSEDVRAFPPPSGTVYNLVEPVELEDITEPGVVVGRVLSNRVVIRRPKPSIMPEWKPDLETGR
ncbi:MAG TPA: hypothetical protein VMW27_03955 [Thermoanaerobaculia bacterium]|nr:hypothetical protein [Thermoanaerobaculia bacterium]